MPAAGRSDGKFLVWRNCGMLLSGSRDLEIVPDNTRRIIGHHG